MSRSLQRSHLAVVAVCLAAVLGVGPGDAHAASKLKIAALGDGAPGGGVFAGPSFTNTPTAAGNGWIAFRALLAEGSTNEQIVVQNLSTNEKRVVANLGQTITPRVGRVKQFLGRPTVNALGDVAFSAIVTPPAEAERAPTDPVPAGVFIVRGAKPNVIEVIAEANQDVDFGRLDITTPVNVLSDLNAADIPERTPGLNDAGEVAFVSTVLNDDALASAILVSRPGAALEVAVRSGDSVADGSFILLGPPVLNNTGLMAFRGLLDAGDASDGIFVRQNGVVSVAVRSGYRVIVPEPIVHEEELSEFGDTLSLNDAGHIAFTGGPLLDLSPNAPIEDDFGVPAVFVLREETVYLVGYPGQNVDGRGRITNFALGGEFGSQVVAPVLGIDGSVTFLATLNNGALQVLFRAAQPPYDFLDEVVVLGGTSPDASPAGGTFLQASSGIGVDGNLGVVFTARVVGTNTSEILVYRFATGDQQFVKIGDISPGNGRGYFAGPPFFPPQLNDRGDVAFRSYVAGGPGIGIFRWREGTLAPVVRLGDLAPIDGTPAFINLSGEVSLNAAGDIAFAGVVSGKNGIQRGIFVAGDAGLRKIVMPRDSFDDPLRPGAEFASVSPSPALSDNGAVAFRGRIEYPDPLLFPFEIVLIRENGLFLADHNGIRALAIAGEYAPTGQEFFRFLDNSVLNGPVAFRAPLGSFGSTSSGVFLADASGLAAVAVAGQPIEDGRQIVSFNSRVGLDTTGAATFLGRVTGDESGTPAILRRRPDGVIASLASAGGNGPAGGVFRSVGRPAVSTAGTVAFRANFEPFSGGTAGFFLADALGVRPYMQTSENAPSDIGGRMTSLNQAASLNARNMLAFMATVSGGDARNGVFLASPAGLTVARAALRLKPPTDLTSIDFRPKDRVRLNVTLQAGQPTFNGFDPTREPVAVSLQDMRGTLWSATLPAGSFRKAGRAFVLKGRDASDRVAKLRLKPRKDGTVRATLKSRPFDSILSFTGLREFFDDGTLEVVPPFTVRLEIGDDAATVTVPCTGGGKRFDCGG